MLYSSRTASLRFAPTCASASSAYSFAASPCPASHPPLAGDKGVLLRPVPRHGLRRAQSSASLRLRLRLLPSSFRPVPSALCLVPSSFNIQHSPFIILYSSFILHPSSFRLCLLPSAASNLPLRFSSASIHDLRASLTSFSPRRRVGVYPPWRRRPVVWVGRSPRRASVVDSSFSFLLARRESRPVDQFVGRSTTCRNNPAPLMLPVSAPPH